MTSPEYPLNVPFRCTFIEEKAAKVEVKFDRLKELADVVVVEEEQVVLVDEVEVDPVERVVTEVARDPLVVSVDETRGDVLDVVDDRLEV